MSTFEDGSFGKYQLLKRLAMGGMAELFRAKHLGAAGFERDVVIKRIHPEFSEDNEFVRMFTNEAKLAAFLRHPNIVQVIDFDQVNGTYYIAMELIEGADLKRTLLLGNKVETPLPLQLAVYIGIQICKGLMHAHELNRNGESLQIVHRDISPHNILLSEQGEVKVTDFGIARVMQQAGVTASGVLKGKASYMAPEQTYSSQVDCRADVFATGILLWEMMCGGRLFQASNDLLAVNKVREADIPLPHEVNPAISKELSNVIMKALERPLEDRTPNARTLMRGLQQFLWLPSAGEELSQYLKCLLAGQPAPKRFERFNVSNAPSGHHNVALPKEAVAEAKSDDTQQKPATSHLDAWTPPGVAPSEPVQKTPHKLSTARLESWSPPGSDSRDKPALPTAASEAQIPVEEDAKTIQPVVRIEDIASASLGAQVQDEDSTDPSSSRVESASKPPESLNAQDDESEDWITRTEAFPSAKDHPALKNHLALSETMDFDSAQEELDVLSTVQVNPAALLGDLSKITGQSKINQSPLLDPVDSTPLIPQTQGNPPISSGVAPASTSRPSPTPARPLQLSIASNVNESLAMTQLDPHDPDDLIEEDVQDLSSPLPQEAVSTDETVQVNPSAVLGDLSKLTEENFDFSKHIQTHAAPDYSHTITVEPTRQTPWLLWGGGLLAIALGGLLIWLMMSS